MHEVQITANTRSSGRVPVALLLQIVLAIYLQIVEWVPLAPWNNIANGNGQAQLDVIIAIVQISS
jgi:hypothetical protein